MGDWRMSLNTWLRKVPVWPGYILGFAPAAWLLWLGVENRLGANPVKTLEHELGLIALQLLLASLLVTPILQLTRINLIRFRRLIGLMAFYYVCLHFAVYLFLDLQLNWEQIAKDLTKRPYIIAGASAFLLLIPVAMTSNDWSIRRLGGAAWRSVHKLVYPASIIGAVHFVWLTKTWAFEPVAYLAGMAILVAWRPLRRHLKQRPRQPA
ncbi:protein-methionine-sulfoxide reductase heme-binding subunit MsrQ [Oceanibium sediminis]|uniref:protein-methionine-sulfoxide reductase heme-binding subunit MsrQ n=1 Tax=Oceanibium sediminis TaxID=2026339 RepID=UPI000DD4AD15|nr:protein-methionine-sulfoxide reductase heme-binding subunit MsrQ [Oceanibium sediminis]